MPAGAPAAAAAAALPASARPLALVGVGPLAANSHGDSPLMLAVAGNQVWSAQHSAAQAVRTPTRAIVDYCNATARTLLLRYCAVMACSMVRSSDTFPAVPNLVERTHHAP